MGKEGCHKQTLIDLIYENKFEVVGEVGVWKSHLMRKVLRSHCANIIKEYWAIDQWEVLGRIHGHMSNRTTEDWDDLYYSCCRYMPYFRQLKPLRMTSSKASKIFKNEYFDLIFIDASHLYIDVLDDIKFWLPKVKKGGILCGHDYGIGGRKGHRVKDAVDEIFDKVELLPGTVWTRRI